ncbi:MAG: TIGR02221 family CRISPR-associated protein [Paludibacteraceae bacterium]|nr:TIGR02221 family CRISPR-associated protein [Paludibacteraceae bacterium]
MKKVLILTLGGGKPSKLIEGCGYRDLCASDKKRIVEERLRDNIGYGYDPIEYRFAGNEDSGIRTEYVAEALIQKELPDFIFILGTTRSSWADFYRKYSDSVSSNRSENIIALLDMGDFTKTGDEVAAEELRKNTELLSEIFRNDFSHSLFAGCPSDLVVKPILLRYGINDEQLRENYEILAHAWLDLDKNEIYDVSFDITHSFRSLPIYNLSLLDYQRQIADYNISISHVYYGNAEISREKGFAPIVDLIDLVNVMDLSRGVSEFRELGYSMTLVKQIPERMGDFRESLERFYWAVQMNDISGICTSIKSILDQLNQAEEFGGRYVDLKNMIREALRDILGGEPEQYRYLKTPQQAYTLTFLLAKWHINKRRYSSAAVAAQESFAVFLAGYYLQEKFGKPLNSFSYPVDYNDATKKEAIEQFDQQYKKVVDGKYKGLRDVFLAVRAFRNDASHPSGREVVDSARDNVEKLVDYLAQLYFAAEDDVENFVKSYRIKRISTPITEASEVASVKKGEDMDSPQGDWAQSENAILKRETFSKSEEPWNMSPQTRKEGSAKKLGIYIGKKKPTDYLRKIPMSENRQFYCLNKDVYDRLFNGVDNSPERWARSAHALYRYLQNKDIDLQQTPVLIDVIPETSFFVVEVLGFNSVYHAFYFGSNGFTPFPYRDVYKKNGNGVIDKTHQEKLPNLGIFQFRLDRWQMGKAEELVERINNIPLEQWS